MKHQDDLSRTTKHCKRSRWFELACLVERAEFELQCGLRPARPRTVGISDLSVWLRVTHRGIGVPRRSVYTTHGCKPTPLLVPIPGQLLGQLCERKLAWCTSFQHRFYQIRGEKCRTDELAHVTFAFAQRGAIMRHFPAQEVLEPLMRLGEGMDESQLIWRRTAPSVSRLSTSSCGGFSFRYS